jgi:hypothetical protein
MVGESFRVAGVTPIVERIADDLRLMAAPGLATNPDGLAARLDRLLGALPVAAADLLDPNAISAMTQIGHDRADSLHRLVMDLHKRLNVLQAELAEETVDGAAAPITNGFLMLQVPRLLASRANARPRSGFASQK